MADCKQGLHKVSNFLFFIFFTSDDVDVMSRYNYSLLGKAFFYWHAMYVSKVQSEYARKNRAFRGLRKMTVGLLTIDPQFVLWKLKCHAVSSWAATVERAKKVKNFRKEKFLIKVREFSLAWRASAWIAREAARRTCVRERKWVECFFHKLKRDAEHTHYRFASLRALVAVGLYRRAFVAWEEFFLDSCVERSRLLSSVQAQCEKLKKQLANVEVRAGTSVRERDTARKSLGMSEEKVRKLEGDKIKLEERLAKTQDRLVQSENLSARRLTRSVQAEARVKRLMNSAVEPEGNLAEARVKPLMNSAAEPEGNLAEARVKPLMNSAAELEGNLAETLQCPITMQLPVDPVIAADNFTYDRCAIEAHFACRGAVSPMTNAPLESMTLRSNTMVRQVFCFSEILVDFFWGGLMLWIDRCFA